MKCRFYILNASTSILAILLSLISCEKNNPVIDSNFPVYIEKDGVFLKLESQSHDPAASPPPTVTFGIAEPGHARLALYSATGYELQLLLDEDLGPGTYGATIEVTNDDGELYKTGVYIIELVIDEMVYLELRFFLL